MMSIDLEERQAIRSRISQDASLGRPFVIMNVLATIVGSYGLLVDSSAVVIGAMLIALLLGPIIGIALGVVDGDRMLLQRALKAEAAGTLVVLGIAFVIGYIHRDVPLGHEIMARTAPSIFDLIIAVAGGAAGAYAIASPRVGAGLAGVAIATALVPPLAASGLLLARGAWTPASGAFLLFFVNLVAIQTSSSIVLWVLGYHVVTPHGVGPWFEFVARNGLSALVLVVMIVVFGVSFQSTLTRQLLENRVRDVVAQRIAQRPEILLVGTEFVSESPVLDLRITLRTERLLSYAAVVDLQTEIATDLQRPVAIKIVDVPIVTLDPLVPPTLTSTATPTRMPAPTATPTSTPTPLPSPTTVAFVRGTPTLGRAGSGDAYRYSSATSARPIFLDSPLAPRRIMDRWFHTKTGRRTGDRVRIQGFVGRTSQK